MTVAHPIIENVNAKIRSMGMAWDEQFEEFRDELNELPPESVSELLELASEPHPALLLFATVLADNAYPLAVPLFLVWLDSTDNISSSLPHVRSTLSLETNSIQIASS